MRHIHTKHAFCIAGAAIFAAFGAAAGVPDSDTATAMRHDNGISAPALARAQQKFGHAQQIASQLAGRAESEGMPASWRMELVSALMRAPEAEFSRIQENGSVRDALNTAHDLSGPSAAQPKNLGDPGDDLIFIPLAIPCRIVDTRQSGAGGPIPDHTARAFTFDANLATQGGSNCTPFGGYQFEGNPGAAAMNITVDASGSTAALGSFLKAYPDGGSATTSWLNFSTGQIVSNQGILGINITNRKFDIFVNATANVIVDVYGSFVAPEETPLQCTNTTNSDSFLGVVGATCSGFYTVTGGGCNSDSIYDYVYSAAPSGNGYACGFFSVAGHSVGNLTAYARCCRVPGRSPAF